MFDMNNELLPLFRPQLNVFPRRHYSTGPSYEAALASIRVWIPTNHDRGTSSVHYRAIIVNTVTDGEVCLEGQGTSAGSHLAVQGDGGTTIRTIARGNQLALGTFITRDNGHIAILLLAVTNIACRVPTPMHRHAAYCKVRVEEARVGVDSVEAVVDTPNVHLAVAAEHRSRVHRSRVESRWWGEHTVDDVHDTVGRTDICLDDLGVLDCDRPRNLVNVDRLSLEGLDILGRLQILCANSGPRNHMVLEDGLKLLDVLRLEQGGQSTIGKCSKGLVGRSEDSEGTRV